MSHYPDNLSQAAFSARYEPRLLPPNASEQLAEHAMRIRRINEFRSWLADIDPADAFTASADDALHDVISDLQGAQRRLLDDVRCGDAS
nr:hypothetical protein [uncultured Lichenicoccus sp.]